MDVSAGSQLNLLMIKPCFKNWHRGKPAHQGPLVAPAEVAGKVLITKVKSSAHQEQMVA